MRTFFVSLGAVALATAGAGIVKAEPEVAVSIAPAHSLVAEVMDGVATPSLLTPTNVSPHHYAMRPSEAKALNNADIVFWIGPAFEGWMVRPLGSLPEKTRVVTLSEAEGVTRLELREGGVWEAHLHDHGDGDHDHGHGHDHAKKHGHKHDHSHEKKHGHKHDHGHSHEKKHAHKHDHGHSHSHEKKHEHADAKTGADAFKVDQHFWLDPRNAVVWVEEITRVLVAADAANADRYKANAVRILNELDVLEKETAKSLASVRDQPFIVFHDAYRYFEERFGLQAAGSISLPDAGAPGPARLAEVRKKIIELGAVCVFTEPQFPPRLARLATDGTTARLGELDPIGVGAASGVGQYLAVIRGLGQGLKKCLSDDAEAKQQ